jgi:hypothetical protein
MSPEPADTNGGEEPAALPRSRSEDVVHEAAAWCARCDRGLNAAARCPTRCTLLLYFALTLFVSAALLFLVQPMVGKMILPSLGGTPAVWNTCMVFFQGVLLVGYAYTHTVSTWHSRSRQLVAQVTILLLPFLVLPFSLGQWRPPEESNPIFSVLWLLLGMVGLPFFVPPCGCSTNGNFRPRSAASSSNLRYAYLS